VPLSDYLSGFSFGDGFKFLFFLSRSISVLAFRYLFQTQQKSPPNIKANEIVNTSVTSSMTSRCHSFPNFKSTSLPQKENPKAPPY